MNWSSVTWVLFLSVGLGGCALEAPSIVPRAPVCAVVNRGSSTVPVVVCSRPTSPDTIATDDGDSHGDSFSMGNDGDDDDPMNTFNNDDETTPSPDSMPDAGSSPDSSCAGITC